MVAEVEEKFASSDREWQSLVATNFGVAALMLVVFGCCFAVSFMVLLQSERYAASLTSKTKQLKRDKRT